MVTNQLLSVPPRAFLKGDTSHLLFSLFDNGLMSATPDSRFFMFTDDLKLFRKIECVPDYVTLQEELDSLVLWFNSIGLHFNIGKCKCMIFSRSRSPTNRSSIDGVTNKKDLGVLFSSNLNFLSHIETICCIAFEILGFIIRSSSEFNLSASLKTMYSFSFGIRICGSPLGSFYSSWILAFKTSSEAFLVICCIYFENYLPSA